MNEGPLPPGKIGAIEDGPNVKYLIIAFDTKENLIDYDPGDMSVFDALGVLSICQSMAADQIPSNDYEEAETE